MAEQHDDQLYKQIGQRISKARHAHDHLCTQAELAKLLGITRASVSNIERGDQRVSISYLYAIAHHLRVPLQDLLPPLRDFYSEKIEGTSENWSSNLAREIREVSEEMSKSEPEET